MIRKVLLIRFSSIGDIVLSTGLICSLKEAFPYIHITYITKPEYHDLLCNHSKVDRLYLYKGIQDTRDFLRRSEFDLIIDAHNSLRSNLVCYGTKNVLRVPKYFFSRWMSVLTKRPSIFARQNLRIKDLLQDLVQKKISGMKTGFPTELDVDKIKEESILLRIKKSISSKNSKSKTKTRQIESNIKIESKISYIVVVPGAAYKSKQWPQEYFASLMNSLSTRLSNMVFILVGGQKDIPTAQSIQSALKKRVRCINWAGELSIMESMAIIKNADLVLVNDTGMLHVAESFKVRTIAFFGPTTKDFGFYPYRETTKVMEHDLDCRPCSLHGKSNCSNNMSCLRHIKPEEVLKELVGKLST